MSAETPLQVLLQTGKLPTLSPLTETAWHQEAVRRFGPLLKALASPSPWIPRSGWPVGWKDPFASTTSGLCRKEGWHSYRHSDKLEQLGKNFAPTLVFVDNRRWVRDLNGALCHLAGLNGEQSS